VRSALLLGLAVTAAVAIVAFSARVLIWGSGPDSIHDPATLGHRITVCDRQLKGPGPIQTLESIHAVDSDPVLVDPAPRAPCPQGACTRVAAGACATVAYIRVGEDAYVAYELVGGP
jgi:hypothetical protein